MCIGRVVENAGLIFLRQSGPQRVQRSEIGKTTTLSQTRATESHLENGAYITEEIRSNTQVISK